MLYNSNSSPTYRGWGLLAILLDKNKKEQIESATIENDLINNIEELKINNFLKF